MKKILLYIAKMLQRLRYGISAYKIFVLITLCLNIACQANKDDFQIDPPQINNIVLSGRIFGEFDNGMISYAYKLQLIEGHVNYEEWADRNFVFVDVPIIVSDKSQYYEFTDLHTGDYTICAVKSGFKPFMEYLHIDGRYEKVLKNIEMLPESGFSGKFQILDENANEISKIEFPRGTQSIFLYVFNGTSEPKYINIYALPEESYIGKSFIINGELEHIYSSWVKEIKKSSNIINSNDLMLVEIIIDPLLYMLREHSGCTLIFGNETELKLLY